MSIATVGRRGKNLALRFPNEIASQLHLREGERVEIEAGPDQIVLRRAQPHYTLETMFAGKSPPSGRRCMRTLMTGVPMPAAKSLRNDRNAVGSGCR